MIQVAVLSLSLRFEYPLIMSSKVTVANEFTPELTVDSAPLNIPETKSPGNPGTFLEND